MNPNSEKRVRDLESIRALRTLLQKIIENPSEYTQEYAVLAMLSSQGAMAKFRRADLEIKAMSLNHQKAMAVLAIGDYQQIDRLRRSASREIELEKKRNAYKRKNTKSDLATKNQRLEHELVRLREDLVLLQRAYDLRCSQARNYANEAGQAILAQCNKEQREIDVSLSSLKNRAKQTSNVISLRDSNA